MTLDADIDELIKLFNGPVMTCEQTWDSRLLSILDEEIKNAGLKDKEIYLLVPEPGGLQYLPGEENLCGDVKFTYGSYQIMIYPEIIARYEERGASIRSTIRHELAHIKYGDCSKRRFPWRFLNRLYNRLVEEPRAEKYAAEE